MQNEDVGTQNTEYKTWHDSEPGNPQKPNTVGIFIISSDKTQVHILEMHMNQSGTFLFVIYN